MDIQSMVREVYQGAMVRKEIWPAVTAFAQPLVHIEDALGWIFSVPLEIVGSWTVRHPLSFLLKNYLMRNHRPCTRSLMIGFPTNVEAL